MILSKKLTMPSLFLALIILSHAAYAKVNIEELYDARKHRQFFVFEEATEKDLAKKIPPVMADFKTVGVEDESNALAVKLGMIRRARHTIDMAYYIFKRDIVGYGVLYEVCQAVKRGVDVRILIDSIGSIHPTHGELKALKDCTKDAGFIYDEDGVMTSKRARIQAVVFNPIIDFEGTFRGTIRRIWNVTVGLVLPEYRVAYKQGFLNRRMHEKLLLIDGRFSGKALAIVGGRNISIDYYGLDKDGAYTPDSYKDTEVLIKDLPSDQVQPEHQFGHILSNHFDKLFAHLGNKKLRTLVGIFNKRYQKKMQKSIEQLEKHEEISSRLANIDEYMNVGFSTSLARWVHELQNLTSRKVNALWKKHENSNPNSIEANLRQMFKTSQKRLVIVSPYLFFRKTPNASDPESRINEYASIQAWLAEDPERTIEIITNSVLTSDNFMAQSVFDQEVAPELLTRQEELKKGKLISEFENFGQEIMSQAEFDEVIKGGRIKIWEMGRLDAVEFGGKEIYGKLHSKIMTFDDAYAFVSTFNGDFRSRDYNSESGLFIFNKDIAGTLNNEADLLRARSLKWGSEEWQTMKRKVAALGGIKGLTTKHQRKIYKIIVNIPFLYWAL